MTNKGKMTMIKTTEDEKLDSFFGTKKEDAAQEAWRVSLIFTKEDEKIIREGFAALPRNYKAIRDYFREAVLEIASRDKEKGVKIKELMNGLEN